MPTIKVRVSGKIAENLTPEVKIVCRNSDYKVEFEFDEPWQAHELKTALFVYNGASVPVPFSGNVCEMPELYNTTLCAIGVFAGDLITTTPAYVDCLKAISDLGGGEMTPPTEDVYNKLVQMIESGMLKGEQGEKGDKGEKGDAGAIKFITVVALPTENIDESAIYLVPIENADGENRFTEYAYIDGKWETLGAISIQVDHSEYVKFTDYAKNETGKAGTVLLGSANSTGLTAKNNQLELTGSTLAMRQRPKSYRVAVVSDELYSWIKYGIVDNDETLTDKDKTNACDWLGALKAQNPDFTDGGATRGYVYFIDVNRNQVVKAVQIQASSDTIPLRNPNGNFYVNIPILPYECTNKGYVDNLPDYLTLTDEQKAKWKTWLENILN